ncbi:MAG: hypothetical protein ACE37M_10580 [Henriciella sp.]
MSVSIIGIIIAALAALSVLRSSALALTIVCCAGLLQAASAMAFGPANITPGHLSLLFFGAAVLIRERSIAFGSLALQPGRPGMTLLLLSIWALVSSVVLPRLFSGSFLVFPLAAQTRGIIEVPLQATSSNFNQAVYFLAGIIVFAMVSSMARSAQMIERAAMAIIICTFVNFIIVFIDTVTFAAGLSSLLDFIRNADYAQLFSHQFMGIKRVTGSFPEASSFATTSVGLFAFSFRLWRAGVKPRLTGIAALLTFVALLFTFSSTAYAAIAVYLAFAYAVTLTGMDIQRTRNPFSAVNKRLFIAVGPLLALLGAIAIAIAPEILDPIVKTFDNSIASKLGSASGIERTSWNMGGLNAFVQTLGLGAGTGSVRTSSFVVGVLANLGIIGAILFGVFFYQLFRFKPELNTPWATEDSVHYASAARAGCINILIASSISGSSVDLGIHFYVMAGIACASLFYQKASRFPLNPNAPAHEPNGVVAALIPNKRFV